MRILQIVNSLQQGDAIGNEAFTLHDYFVSLGFNTEILYLLNRGRIFAPRYKNIGSPYSGYKITENDILLIHESMYDPMLPEIRNLPNSKINRYHNITPSQFFRYFDPALAFMLDQGRQQILEAANHYHLALADSTFNAKELQDAGYTRVDVIPVFADFQRLTKPSIPPQTRQTRTILTVGRVVPNKRVEDVIRLFYVYNTYLQPDSKLWIVGAHHLPLYSEELNRLIHKLGLVEKVSFVRFVSDKELSALYAKADILVGMSEHEGFWVPALEGMHMGVPVMARADTAAGETLGESGIKVFPPLEFDLMAEVMHQVIEDASFREEIVQGQYSRLEHFHHDKIKAMWKRQIEGFVGVTSIN